MALSSSPWPPTMAELQALRTEIMTPKPMTFWRPEPGERDVWRDKVWWGEGDDGGGAAIAFFRYGRCPFAESR